MRRPACFHPLRPLLLAAALAATGPLAAAPLDMDLPAQPLGTALRALARQAGLTLAADDALLAGRQAPALRGRLEPAEALRRLLTGSGLEAVQDGPTWIVRRVPPAAASEAPAVVRITGARQGADLPGERRTATGGFGEQSVLDTPFTVSVISAERLREQGVVTIEQALRYVTGASASYASGAYNYFNVRGNIPTTLIDGSPHWGRARYSLENVDRVEFLQGPAALRGGFGGPGGAVNLVSKRPTAGALTEWSADLDSWGARRLTLDASRRTESGEFGSRVNLAYERIDDQWNLPGERYFAAVANDWRLHPQWRLTLDADFLDDRRVYAGEYATDADGRLVDLDPRRLYGQPWADQHTQAFTGRLGAQWDFAPAWRARFQLGGYRYKELWNAHYMGPIQANGDYQVSWLANRGLRKGVNFTASADGEVLAGGWRHALSFAVQQVRGSSALGYTDTEVLGTSNIRRPVYFPRRAVDVALADPTRTRETSLVATDEIHFDERWSLLVGARHSRYHTDQDDYRASATLPVAAVLYKPVPGLTTYVSYAASLEPGGTAPEDASNRGEQLEARRSRQVELGAKWSALDGRLLVTGAAFQIHADYWGYTNAQGRYVQDGYQALRGLELAVDGQVAPGWKVQGGATWLRDILHDTGDALQDGQQSSAVPRQSLNFSVTHDLAAWPGLAVNAGVFHTGWFNSYNYDVVKLVRLPSVTTAEAGLRYRWKTGGSQATVRLQVTNLFDRQGWQPYFYPLQPRTAKLTLEYAL